MAGLLFGVSPNDLTTFADVTLVLTTAGRHVGLSLLKGHSVPAGFNEGDRIRIALASKIPHEPEVETEGRA